MALHIRGQLTMESNMVITDTIVKSSFFCTDCMMFLSQFCHCLRHDVICQSHHDVCEDVVLWDRN